MGERHLAAMVYEAGDGPVADALLTALAQRLKAMGLRVAGAVQRSSERDDRCACDMFICDLASGEERLLSEDRGPMARGCRLDARVLEDLVGASEAALADGSNVLIINKFGKQEALGAGFRQTIARAVAAGVPTIVGVNRGHLEDWHAFAGDLAEELAPSREALEAWMGPHVAAAITRTTLPSQAGQRADTRTG